MTSAKKSSTDTDIGSATKTEAKAAANVARDEAQEVVDRAKDTAASHANAAKSVVADQAEDTAAQVREAGDAFDQGSFADIAASHLADNLTSAADAVRNTDLGSLQQDLTAFARRNPLVFFGGAAVLGFMAARMMKATSQETAAPSQAQPAPTTDFDHDMSSSQGYVRNGYAGSRGYQAEAAK